MNARAEVPLRTILFSSYFDATSTAKDNDYGNFSAITTEDFYFSSSTRSIALSRLRREVRNNPYLAGLVNKYPEAVGYSSFRSRTSSKRYNDAKEIWFARISKRITSRGDSLRTLEDLIKRELLVAGEIFLVELLDGTLQVIPSEFCGSPAGIPGRAGREINGIVYDEKDNPTFYRFGKMSPAGMLTYSDEGLVAAKHVKHIFHKDRVQMGRGLPWLLPSLKTARDLYEITRSKTKQIKDANAISGWLSTEDPVDTLAGLSAPPLDANGDPKVEKLSDAADKAAAGPVVIELKPGTFISLKNGEKLNQLTTQYNATDYKELIMLMLHAMSAPVGLPVELWFSGLGDVNYSGHKGLGVQWNGRRLDIIEFLLGAFFNPLLSWRGGKAANEDEIVDDAGKVIPYPDRDPDLHDWLFRRTPILDDEKEGKSNKIKLESGESDLAEIWEAKGYYPEEVFARRRQLWIKAMIAAGELEEGGDHSKAKVPLDFLLRNELPGEPAVPHMPDGPGQTSATDDAQAAAEEAAESAATAQRAASEALATLAELRRAA